MTYTPPGNPGHSHSTNSNDNHVAPNKLHDNDIERMAKSFQEHYEGLNNKKEEKRFDPWDPGTEDISMQILKDLGDGIRVSGGSTEKSPVLKWLDMKIADGTFAGCSYEIIGPDLIKWKKKRTGQWMILKLEDRSQKGGS